MQVIEPESEMNYLTQKNDSTEIFNRIYSKKIYLAVNDSLDNYKEINESEYQQFHSLLKEYEDAIKKQIDSGKTSIE